MMFSLVICTYLRPVPLKMLLESVKTQTLYPDEILIIDGSPGSDTKDMLSQQVIENLQYHQVDSENRGLTKQRNYGVNLVSQETDVVCFLDDDTELEPTYFEKIIEAFNHDANIVGVGGVAVNENRWVKAKTDITYNSKKQYTLDGFVVKEGLRNVLRNYLGLQSPLLPGQMPKFSHGRTNGYPLNDKIYPVDLLIGMSFNFRKSVFDHISFSTYFEGYGLYEDADFSIRALEYGNNVIQTAARLNHYHDEGGRPNKYKYGKMVLRNGWYVWRLKYPKPGFKNSFKWHLTALLLTLVRFTNSFNSHKRKEAFTESLGRIAGWFTLWFDKPNIER